MKVEQAHPVDEAGRLAALRALALLDTPPEERFDRITRVAQRTLGTPMALLNLVDADRAWCKSRQGVEASEFARDIAFCDHALGSAGAFVVPDLAADPRFAANPLVIGPPHVRFYAGYPLRGPGGHAYGTLCVLDLRPRELSPADLGQLADLAAWAEGELRNDALNQALAALRASEAHHRAVLNALSEGVVLQDEAGRILSANPAAECLLGLSAVQLAERTALDPRWRLVGEDGRSLSHEEFPSAVALRTGRIQNDVTIGIGRSDGTLAWLTVTAQPLTRPDAARPHAVVTSFFEITARKEAETALRAALDELAAQYRAAERARGETRAVIDAANDGMILVGPDRRFLTVNRHFADLFGVEADAIVGRRFDEFGDLVARAFADPAAFGSLVAGTASDTTRQFSTIVAQRWPVARELQLFTTPVASADGGYLGRLYVFRDVTREREVDRLKTEFISLVSHELRTPLTSIKGFVDLLLDGEAGELGDEQREFLGIVGTNADRLVLLINDMLDISRLESGRVELDRHALDLPRLIGGAVGALRAEFAAKGQPVRVEVPADLPAVSGDSGRVQQILGNLLSNAHKYTPPGGAIAVTAAAEGAAVRVSIRDSGIGLSPDEQAQVFTKFYRARNRATVEEGGTGLGLAITRSLVEMHGGEITLSSAPGAGSVFSFTLPLAAASPPVAPDPARARWGGTILVAERDPDIAALLERYLTRAGYRVLRAPDAATALELAHRETPDLITLDDARLAVGARPLLDCLAADPATAAIPTLLISIHGDAAGGRARGLAGTLPKPVDERALLERVSALLTAGQALPRRILVADGDAMSRTLLAGGLRWGGYDVAEATDGDAALAAARRERPDLILLDGDLPGGGLAALRALRAEPTLRETTVVFLADDAELAAAERAAIVALGAAIHPKVGDAYDPAAVLGEVVGTGAMR